MAAKPSLVRGGITLAILAALAGAMVVAPAGAHVTGKFGHLKKHINKIAKKRANQVFNQKIGPATSGFQPKCSDGSVIAYALINVDAVISAATTGGFATTGVSPQFNCAGGPIEARFNTDTTLYDIRIPGVTTGAGGGSGTVAHLEFVNTDCDIGFAVCTSATNFMTSYGTDPGHEFLAAGIFSDDDNDNAPDTIPYAKGDCAGFFFAGTCALAVTVVTK
jgi:hypothetical protein